LDKVHPSLVCSRFSSGIGPRARPRFSGFDSTPCPHTPTHPRHPARPPRSRPAATAPWRPSPSAPNPVGDPRPGAAPSASTRAPAPSSRCFSASATRTPPRSARSPPPPASHREEQQRRWALPLLHPRRHRGTRRRAEQWRAAGTTMARHAATGRAAASGRGGWLQYSTNHSVT
jgi:hypothetical protein